MSLRAPYYLQKDVERHTVVIEMAIGACISEGIVIFLKAVHCILSHIKRTLTLLPDTTIVPKLNRHLFIAKKTDILSNTYDQEGWESPKKRQP